MGEWLRRRRRLREESGATAVEFALIMLPLLYLVFGVIQYSLYFYSMQSGTSAVGDSVRRLAVGDCTTTSELKTFLFKRLGSATTAATASTLNPAVTYTKADGTTATSPGEIGGTVKIVLTYNVLNLHFPFIPVPANGTVTRTVYARVEDTTATTGGCT
jgi:Flp pilus assembly protein TadG